MYLECIDSIKSNLNIVDSSLKVSSIPISEDFNYFYDVLFKKLFEKKCLSYSDKTEIAEEQMKRFHTISKKEILKLPSYIVFSELDMKNSVKKVIYLSLCYNNFVLAKVYNVKISKSQVGNTYEKGFLLYLFKFENDKLIHIDIKEIAE
ncbi:MAG: hypothetical protein V4538_17305 [Bacteroidota bacterium]